jgi:hypothetical protein
VLARIGLRQQVVRTGVEPGDPVFHPVTGRQHQDGHTAARA